MTNKAMKYGIISIVAVLIVTMVFAGAASAEIINIKNATEWQNNISHFENMGTGDIINLTGDIDFEGASTNVVINWISGQSPQIEGNGHTISSFNISSNEGDYSDNYFGLFRYYYGDRIANLTISNFSVSSSGNGVGGLVGWAHFETHIENVSVENGTISGMCFLGGLIGTSYGTIWLNESRVERIITKGGAGAQQVGGLVGYAITSLYLKDSWVNLSEVVGSGEVGGVVGRVASTSSFDNAFVKDCKIGKPGGIYVGGLVGHAYSASVCDVSVENSTIGGSRFVGGLVGYANNNVNVVDCKARYCDVVLFGESGDSVGGLVGYADSASFKNCTAESCAIASPLDKVGGMVGGTEAGASFDICKVANCSLSGKMYVGGLVGGASSASGSPFMNGSSVTNCIISAGDSVGGLVARAGNNNIAKEIGGCVVEKCTIVGRSDSVDGVGGLAGYAGSNCVFNMGNWVKKSAVRGNGAMVGEVVGNETKNIADYSTSGNVTSAESIWLNNNSNAQYPKIYIAKSNISAKQGPERSNFFNDITTDEIPYGAEVVTQLTGYGLNGNYVALSYVYPYSVTAISTENGTISASPLAGAEGTTIAVATTAHMGYHLNRTYWHNESEFTVTHEIPGSHQFTLPANDVIVRGDFNANTTIVRFDNGVTTEDKLNTFRSATVKPADPVKAGYTFVGWNVSLDPGWCEFNNDSYDKSGIWNYTGVHLSVLTVVANWTENPAQSSKQTGYTVILPGTVDTPETMCTVNFTMNGHGIQVVNLSVSLGNTINEPYPAPTADGYTFTGWYIDRGLTSPYGFSTPVTDNLDLYAGWTAKDAKIPTSKSPAPFLGILAGLGAAAVLLSNRRK